MKLRRRKPREDRPPYTAEMHTYYSGLFRGLLHSRPELERWYLAEHSPVQGDPPALTARLEPLKKWAHREMAKQYAWDGLSSGDKEAWHRVERVRKAAADSNAQALLATFTPSPERVSG